VNPAITHATCQQRVPLTDASNQLIVSLRVNVDVVFGRVEVAGMQERVQEKRFNIVSITSEPPVLASGASFVSDDQVNINITGSGLLAGQANTFSIELHNGHTEYANPATITVSVSFENATGYGYFYNASRVSLICSPTPRIGPTDLLGVARGFEALVMVSPEILQEDGVSPLVFQTNSLPLASNSLRVLLKFRTGLTPDSILTVSGVEALLAQYASNFQQSDNLSLERERGWLCSDFYHSKECAKALCSNMCGNGVATAQEECDDGNTNSGDGCSEVCTVECGYSCTGTNTQPNVCSSTCGDSNRAGFEVCDDGNTVSGDGCGSDCLTIEQGWTCHSTTCSRSLCKGICGDGIKTTAEGCDDGNTAASDGCSAACSVECGYSCTGKPSVCACLTSTTCPCGSECR
jgi:cysteine-rich repeat protein